MDVSGSRCPKTIILVSMFDVQYMLRLSLCNVEPSFMNFTLAYFTIVIMLWTIMRSQPVTYLRDQKGNFIFPYYFFAGA